MVAAIAAVLGAAVLAAGCGGSSDADAIVVEPGSLSKKAFILRADKVCAAGQLRHLTRAKVFIDKQKILADKEISPKEGSMIVDNVIAPVYLREAREIAALGAPASDVDAISELVAAIEADIAKDQADPLRVLNENKILPAADRAAKEFGIIQCAVIWI